MSICYLNGNFENLNQAKISPLDRGFLFGDSLYEVMVSTKGNIFKLNLHLERLQRNIEELDYKIPKEIDLGQILQEIVLKNKHINQIVYLQISRGVDKVRNHIPSEDITPTIFIYSHQMEYKFELSSGEKAILVEDYRWRKSKIKATSLLANVLCRIQSKQEGVFEAILHENKNVTEGAVSNVFFCKDNLIKTPPTSQNILPGVTRAVILEILNKNNISCMEENFTTSQLKTADEIWVTNTTKGIIPIIELDGKKVGSGKPGKYYKRVAKLFLNELKLS